jgi:hypothetical protein
MARSRQWSRSACSSSIRACLASKRVCRGFAGSCARACIPECPLFFSLRPLARFAILVISFSWTPLALSWAAHPGPRPARAETANSSTSPRPCKISPSYRISPPFHVPTEPQASPRMPGPNGAFPVE